MSEYGKRYHELVNASTCHSEGITHGCVPTCPVFEKGECEFQKENEIKFIDKGE
jgi:hypothetical protein